MKKETLYLGRLVIRSFGGESFDQIIETGLSGRSSHSRGNFLYHFANYHGVGKIHYGELFKAKLSNVHRELIDGETPQYRDVTLDEFFQYVRFCVFPDHSIVMSDKSIFSADDFIDIFPILIRQNTRTMVNVNVNYRRTDSEIFDIIRHLERLTYVYVSKIRKSNPSPKPSFKQIEDFLDREGVDEYEASFRAEEQGSLNRDLDSHIMSAISLSDAGYGESLIEGHREGKQVTVKSWENAIQARIPPIPHEMWKEFVQAAKEAFAEYIHDDEG